MYELLAGSPPIDAKQFKHGAILEMLLMVLEAEPPSPSAPDAAERPAYRESYDAAIKSKDDFAARFYLNLFPPPERALHQGQGDRLASVRPLVSPRGRGCRPPSATRQGSGIPGGLPETGRNLARILRFAQRSGLGSVHHAGRPEANYRRGAPGLGRLPPGAR